MNSELLSSYKDKHILITGHTGFKGAWLSRILVNAGAKVSGIALEPEADSIYSQTGNFGLKDDLILDIRNRKLLSDFIKGKNFDGVFHLAAQPLVRESYLQPVETFETNLMGTIYLLDSLLQHRATPWVVAITTDKVYHNYEKLEGYAEDEALGGKDPYSASKAAAEIAITAWQNLSNLQSCFKLVSARAGNVIGGGDHAKDRLLPDLIRGFKSNTVTTIRNPKSLRPWQHVLDPLAGYLTLGAALDKKVVSTSYNFGPGESSKLNVNEMADIACHIWAGNKGYQIAINPNDPPEAGLLWLDSSRAKKDLNWETKLDAREAIKWTLDWEQNAMINGPLAALDLQISEFFGAKK